MNHGSQGASESPARKREKRATSTTSPCSRGSVCTTSSDQTSGSSSGVLAHPATSRTASKRASNRIAGVPRSLCMAQRAVNLRGESRQRAEQRVALQAVEHALALALAGDQPGALQHREVARDRGPAHGEALGEVRGGERGLRQEGDDAPARQRGEGIEHALGSINEHVNSMADRVALCLNDRTMSKGKAAPA